jgi:hypothetical protein
MQPYFSCQIKLEVISNATCSPKTSTPAPKTEETYKERGEEDYSIYWEDIDDDQDDDAF